MTLQFDTSIYLFFSAICQIRLDFDTFELIEADGVCTDSFVVTAPTSTNSLPTLCGKLTGQHCKYFL